MVPGSFIGKKKEGWGAQENKKEERKGEGGEEICNLKEYVSC